MMRNCCARRVDYHPQNWAKLHKGPKQPNTDTRRYSMCGKITSKGCNLRWKSYFFRPHEWLKLPLPQNTFNKLQEMLGDNTDTSARRTTKLSPRLHSQQFMPVLMGHQVADSMHCDGMRRIAEAQWGNGYRHHQWSDPTLLQRGWYICVIAEAISKPQLHRKYQHIASIQVAAAAIE